MVLLFPAILWEIKLDFHLRKISIDFNFCKENSFQTDLSVNLLSITYDNCDSKIHGCVNIYSIFDRKVIKFLCVVIKNVYFRRTLLFSWIVKMPNILIVVINVMKNLEGFFFFQEHEMFLNTLFYCIFQETKLEKLQKHLCSQAPNLVLGFTEQTKLNICQAEGLVALHRKD